MPHLSFRRGGDHPSWTPVARCLQQLPSNWAGSLLTSDDPCAWQGFLPCSRWGLPGRLCHHIRRCALTAPFHPHPVSRAVYFLLHFPAGRPGLPLATTVPCGVRTFLDPCQPTCVAVQVAAITRPTHSQPVTVLARSYLTEVRNIVDAADHASCAIEFNNAYRRQIQKHMPKRIRP